MRCPDGTRYGTLRVCVRCRGRRVELSGEVRIDPPIPIDFHTFRHRGARYDMTDEE